MKKAILLVVLAMVMVPLVTSCDIGAPSVDKAKADFCANLGEFGTAVVNLRQIDEGSTLKELEDANKAVQDTWDNLKGSAESLKDAKITGIEQAFDEMENTIGDISDDATLAEAQDAVHVAALTTAAQILATSQTVCTYPQE